MVRGGLVRLLSSPPLTGWQALLCGVAAIAVPTIIRLVTGGTMTGCEFTPYLPFVLVSAILLTSWLAAAVAFVSVAIMGGLFAGPPSPSFDFVCFASAALIFLASSAAMIPR